jgi:aspartate kinase
LKGIDIVIKNLYKPSSPGTIIGSHRFARDDIIKSVSYLPNVATLKVYDTGAGYKSGFLADITACLHKANVNIFSATTSQTCAALLIDEADIPNAKKTVKAIIGTVGENFEVKSGMALICTVGEGFGTTKGIAARVFNAVAAKDVNVDLISAGASMVAYHFTVDRKDLKNTVVAIHDEFWGKNIRENPSDGPVS